MPDQEQLSKPDQPLPPVTESQAAGAVDDIVDGRLSPTMTADQQLRHLEETGATRDRMAEERIQAGLDAIELKPPQE